MIFHSNNMKCLVAEMRHRMKSMLEMVTPAQFEVFQQMYDRNHEHAHPVDAVSFEYMDLAFGQIEKTLKENAESGSP